MVFVRTSSVHIKKFNIHPSHQIMVNEILRCARLPPRLVCCMILYHTRVQFSSVTFLGVNFSRSARWLFACIVLKAQVWHTIPCNDIDKKFYKYVFVYIYCIHWFIGDIYSENAGSKVHKAFTGSNGMFYAGIFISFYGMCSTFYAR